MVGRRWVAVASMALAAVGVAGCNSGQGFPVTVLRGKTTAVNETRTAIVFDGNRVEGPRLQIVDEDGGWIVAGASWFANHSWHDDGVAPCLQKAAPQPVELGVLEAAERDGAPGRGVVVWLKCL